MHFVYEMLLTKVSSGSGAYLNVPSYLGTRTRHGYLYGYIKVA